MLLLITFVWSFLVAFVVFHLIAAAQRARLAASDGTEDDSLILSTAPDPGFAATVTFFFGILAPYFLYRARGWRGVAEGFGLLGLAAVGNVATVVVIAVVAAG